MKLIKNLLIERSVVQRGLNKLILRKTYLGSYNNLKTI